MKKIFKIEVDCAVCANKIEEGIKKVEGVTSCNVNFMTQKMTLEASDEEFDKVLKKVINVAKKIEPDFEIEA
ncbi:MAG: cation transporter [Anaeroplasmataceae bacterium]|nr:cation transporter [Anaeroplasmataceae bacterium]